MKNYEKLSLSEALEYLANQYKEVIEKLSEESKNEQAKVTITIPTHRATPEYKQDSLTLKVQVSEAEKKLSFLYDKRVVSRIMENIREAQSAIDHSLNFEGLVLYADESFSSVVKVPVGLKTETLIGPLFDIRPLYKAAQQLSVYYILTISRNKIRLIEALNRAPLKEYTNNDFPFENTEYYTTNPKELGQDVFTDNLIKEFFNVADKRMKKYMAENPLPLILAGDTKGAIRYREMMDDTSHVVGMQHGNFDNASLSEIVTTVYPLIQEYRNAKQNEYRKDIEDAESVHLAETNPARIYQSASVGNAETLYIGNDYSFELSLNIIGKMIQHGGEIVFMDDELLAKYKGILLKKRY